jgi:hypothetical protein
MPAARCGRTGATRPLADARGHRRGWQLALLVAVMLAGCRTTRGVAGAPAGRSPLVISEARAAACPRSPGGAGATFREALPGAATDSLDVRALAVLPPAARRTAQAAGLEPLIASVLRARERAGNRPSIEWLAQRQQLDAAMAALPPQLLAVEFEAECTIALMNDALAVRAGDRERWTLRYTVASLLVGAASVLWAGLWDLAGTESNGPVIVGIAGAVATTGLGLATLVPPERPIVFRHPQHLLAPLAAGQDPERVYPTFVFRLLTLPTPGGAPTPREQLLTEWRRLLAETVPPPRRDDVAALLWGPGGRYDEAQLRLRRQWYEALESTLDSFARDVDLLSVTLARVLAGTAGDGATG